MISQPISELIIARHKLCCVISPEPKELCGAVQRHLIPGLLTEHGLTPDQLAFPSEAVTLIADGYTREVSLLPLHMQSISASKAENGLT